MPDKPVENEPAEEKPGAPEAAGDDPRGAEEAVLLPAEKIVELGGRIWVPWEAPAPSSEWGGLRYKKGVSEANGAKPFVPPKEWDDLPPVDPRILASLRGESGSSSGAENVSDGEGGSGNVSDAAPGEAG